MRAALTMAGLLGVVPPALAQDAQRPSSTVVIEQVAASGRRLALAALTCPKDHCEDVVRLDAHGASFGMAVRIDLSSDGARFTLRGCEPGAAEADCGPYGAFAGYQLLVPLGPEGYGRRTVVIGRTPPTMAGSPPGVEDLVLRRESGVGFLLMIEVARRPE